MKKILENKIVRWMPAFLWAGLIFYLSAQGGDADQQYPMGVVYFLERKFFHVLEYMVLAALLYRALRSDFSKIDALRQTLIFSLIFAFSDEWHQTTVPGRDGTLRDVGIDFLGIALVAVIIFNYPQWKKKWWK